MKTKRQSTLMLAVLVLAALLMACSGKKSKTDSDGDAPTAYTPAKGDLRVMIEFDEPPVIDQMTDYSTDSTYLAVRQRAVLQSWQAGKEYADAFFYVWANETNGSPLARLFATQHMRDKVNINSSDEEVITAVHNELEAARSNILEIVRTRLSNAGYQEYQLKPVEDSPNRFEVVVARPKDKAQLLHLLVAAGNIEFWETYKAEEVYQYLNILLTQYTAQLPEPEAAPSLGFISFGTPVAGMAWVGDTASINRMLQSDLARQILPRNMRLLWSAQGEIAPGESKTQFSLYAINTRHRTTAPINGSVITEVKGDVDETGRPYLSMQMNAEGARLWADMTRKNAVDQRAIAIVIDDAVLSAPTVHGEIVGGNSQITGNFTKEDIKNMASILNAGRLPAPLRIIMTQTVE